MRIGWEIMPGLIQRGLFNQWSMSRKIAFMHSEQVGIVVNLTRTEDADLKGWMDDNMLMYLQRPVPDGKEFDPKLMKEIADEVVGWMNCGWTAVIHCRAGRNRSGFISALVLMEMQGISGAEAVRIVKEKRPLSLYNEHFVEYLESLEAPCNSLT